MPFLCSASCSSTASTSASALELARLDLANAAERLEAILVPMPEQRDRLGANFERCDGRVVCRVLTRELGVRRSDCRGEHQRACATSACAALVSDVAAASAARLRPQKSSCHENVNEALA